MLPTALFAVLFLRWLGRDLAPLRLRTMLALALVFATPLRFYADLVFGHVTAGLCAAGALFVLDETVDDPHLRARALLLVIAAGLLAGGCFMIEYLGVMVPIGGAVLLLLGRRPRLLAPFMVSVLVPVSATLAYHRAAFGSPWSPGYAHLVTGYASGHAGGLFGVGGPSLEALMGLSVSLHRGLFVLAPWLVLAAPGAVALVRRSERRPFAAAALVVVIGWALLASGFTYWDGGGAAGPRHVVAVIPLLAALSAPALGHIEELGASPRARWARSAVSGLVTYAFIVTAMVVSTFCAFQPARANPYRDVTLALLERGIVWPSVATALGLEGLASVVPHALFTLALAIFAVRAVHGRRVRLHEVGVALASGGLLLAVLLTRAPDAADAAVRAEVDALARQLAPVARAR